MTMTFKACSRVVLCCALAGWLVIGLASCKAPGIRKGGLYARYILWQREHTVPIQGSPVTVGRFLGVDVENNAGSLEVITHPRYNEARVEFRVRHLGELKKLAKHEGWSPDVLKGPWFEAVHENDAETGILRIRATTRTLPDGSRPKLDLRVMTPVCDGVIATTDHGGVELVGVRGQLEVESTGLIEVRTDEPLTAPVMLRSSGKGVLVVAAPESRGTFLITAPEGRATFTSAFGTTRRVTGDTTRWSGVWNGGTNPVTLHADNGHARYMVKPNAELYTPTF